MGRGSIVWNSRLNINPITKIRAYPLILFYPILIICKNFDTSHELYKLKNDRRKIVPISKLAREASNLQVADGMFEILTACHCFPLQGPINLHAAEEECISILTWPVSWYRLLSPTEIKIRVHVLQNS